MSALSPAPAASAAENPQADELARLGTVLARLGRRARTAGRQIWLAGLGALDVAAGLPRFGERGRRTLERLAAKGEPIAARHRARLRGWSDRAGRTVEGAATLARDTASYEGRRLLERFDLATAEDLRQLAARLEALDRKLDDYAARQGLSVSGEPSSD